MTQNSHQNLLITAILLILVNLLAGTPYAMAAKTRTHQYWVEIGPELKTADVRICFDGKAPEYLAVDYRKATANLIDFPQTKQGHIEFHGRYWKTRDLKQDACLNYRVDISQHSKKRGRINSSGTKLAFQTDNTWLWMPERINSDERVILNLELPDGYHLSAPWKMLNPQGTKFEIGRMPQDWGFSVLYGDFDFQSVKLKDGSQLNVAMLNHMQKRAELKQWVTDIGNSLTDYLGKFPVEQLQVMVLQSDRFKGGAVPWGEVRRGGGFGIGFVVNSEAPIEEFYADWTATHEFSHLLVPNLEQKDSWMSEGLASYLQYVLMAQSNQITQQQAWQKLYEGFNRGLKGTRSSGNEKLVEVASNRKGGWRSGRTMRIYWSGAVYFMAADLKLRQYTDGEMGLPQLLAKFNHCCISRPEEWSGMGFARKLDRLSRSRIFSELYRDIGFGDSFPDFEELFEELGISIEDDQVLLEPKESYRLRDEMIQ